MTPKRSHPDSESEAGPDISPEVGAEPEPVPEFVPPPTYQQTDTPCRHLRNKGMYVYTDGPAESHGDYDNTIYWCLRSMKAFGPDRDEVHREYCSDPARSCYEAL
ncbi:hypothetical protein BH23PLA1_BH23PLA1_05030 [soil metagenome]